MPTLQGARTVWPEHVPPSPTTVSGLLSVVGQGRRTPSSPVGPGFAPHGGALLHGGDNGLSEGEMERVGPTRDPR